MAEPPVLRAYQQESVGAIRAAFARRQRRVVHVLPTGGGKTVVFVAIATSATTRGRRTLILVHRQELVRQASEALAAFGVPHGLIAAGKPETEAPVQVASVATLARRLHRAGSFDLIVIDETHHATAETWGRVLDAYPAAYVLGVTATPERLDRRGLGTVFDAMVEGPSVAELTRLGHLVPAIVYAPPLRLDLTRVRRIAGDYAVDELADVMSDAALIGDAVQHYGDLAGGAPAVAFCVNLAHSRLVAERFAAAGIRAAHVDGDTNPDERARLIAALGTGELQVLTNCGLISEGTDVPAIGAAILLRPTQSLAMYLQQVGRALRPHPGKVRAVVLDHAGCTWQHGLPDAPRAWSLEDRPRRGREPREAAGLRLRLCPACDAVNGPGTPSCAACGEPLTPTPTERADEESLVEVRRQEHVRLCGEIRAMSYAAAMRWAGADEERLRLVARVRGYRNQWIGHRLREMSSSLSSSGA